MSFRLKFSGPRYPYLKGLLFLLFIGLAACQSPAEEAAPADVAPPAATTVAATVAPTAAPVATPTAVESTAGTDESTPALADILTILARAEGLEEFAAVAEQVGLAEVLSAPGSVTVLVPPTAAFEQLADSVRADTELMGTILRAHIIEGKFLLNELAEPVVVTNLNGDELTLMVGQTGGTIRGSNVLGGDFEAKNGMIHVIDTVILPDAVEAEVLAQYDSVVGEQLYPMQGNIHIANNETSPLAYRSIPPTSGPHYPNIAAWQVYADPIR
ncbi:MAG: fasciclin domain-containing protein [Caldilineaceae bacterium]